MTQTLRQNLLHYRWVESVTPSVDEGRLELCEPRNLLERVIAWVLRWDGRFIGRSVLEKQERSIAVGAGWPDVPNGSPRVAYQETTLNLAPILPIVRQQLAHCRREGYRPTKVVVGPQTYHRILLEDRYGQVLTSFVGLSTHQVETLFGLDLVINPCIEGVAVA